MLRDKNLIPLSHQHQHALAMCVRLDRALVKGDANLDAWQEEIAGMWESEIRFHFEAEEKVLFPAADKYASLRPLVKQLLSEHATLRDFFARATARSLDAAALKTFVETLAQHIRAEERQLFEECQRQMPVAEMARAGAAMDDYFAKSGMPGASCALLSASKKE
ncbi:MAG: hemerythrin domain-containing protein [Terriglobales bacterium]